VDEDCTVEVNGSVHVLACDSQTPLLWVLRDALGLTGTRFGCGVGSCGACTVHLDGVPVHACDTPMWSAAGHAVTTIEGITATGPHPVQDALIAQQAGQCGYCLSGIVMRATALVDDARRRGGTLTDGEVRSALDDHLCRCGAHNRIVDAILEAAAR
jgi:nicotinate dehydrogenase subunit A